MNDIRLNRWFVETGDEEEACRLLFKAYYETVFNTVKTRRWNHPDTVVDPDEITSDTFIKAVKKRKGIQEPEKLLEWLKRVAENLMIDAIRRSRQKRHLEVIPLNTLSNSESETLIAGTDAEAKEVLEAQLFRLLQDQHREIVDLLLDGIKPKKIAEVITSTSEADKEQSSGSVQKTWERVRKWLFPIARNLEALINCLPEANDKKIMERYFDRQSFSEITEALGISRSTIEETAKRVIADWKEAAKDNPEDPVSAMVKKEK
ncbi:MAG: sigma-70 family RNA polymerase sigma factor [Candidatus Poribacteria bacterium]|nr:sigma-70 family RNA polymerase sigma factor [Candidatus Poribacteria bacterium]